MKRVWSSVALLLLFIPAVAWGQVIVGPDQMNQCDQASFTVTITNASATQAACLLTITHSLPNDGFLYVPGSTIITLDETAETFTDDPIGNVWDIDAIRGSAYALPPGETVTISYEMTTTCAAVSGTDIITVDFEDCDDPGVPLQNVSSTSVEILPGAIVVSKTPSIQDASVGDLVTWTITVENTGIGTVSNVEVVDVLGSGLAYNSDTGNGVNAGQTTTWDAGTTPALASIDVDASVSIDLTAEVISCSGLVNDVDASFGCGPADSCFNTATDGGTAIASLRLLVDNPALSFTPPNVTVAYCTDETAGLVQIVNSGLGTARHVSLCCDFAHLAVDPSRLPPGTSYADNCFSIPDIPGGETFDLTFFVLHPTVDWCAEGPSGANVFELSYTNDCNIPFVAYPQFSTLSSSSGPSLVVTKTGPDFLRLGETGDYDVSVEYVGSADCGGGSPGPVTIVDTYPEGFTVVDPAGGTVDMGTRTITWAYDPTIDPPFSETVQLQAPTDCGYCANPGGDTDDNSVTATGTDCCGCTIVGTAAAPTTILCEGYGDDADLFSSTMELATNTVLRCSSDYDAEVTHTYVFADDPALDDLLLSEITYFMDGNNDLVYETGTAAVTGATLGTIVDGTPSGRLELSLTDNTSVRGKTIIFSYQASILGLDDPSCQASSYPINAGIELDPGASSIDYCGTMYADPDQRLAVTAQPPAMSVSIDGIPVVQEYCATYDVTITLNRTSTLAKPYDARIVLTNHGGSILDMSQAVCGGTVSPTDGTTCMSPVTGASTYEWRFADVFDSDADIATITFPVTVPCSGPLADLSVAAYYDDLCHDDVVYNDSCSTSSSDEAVLSLSADIYVRKSPEILYATTRDVSWSLVVHNTGNGTAYNVWVDDVLGGGLVFDEVNTLPVGAVVSPNLDHTGAPINGASFLFDELAPGELKTITLAADLVACTGLTNSIAASWGCDGESCQTPRTDTSSVVVPTDRLVATSFSPTPVPMCSTSNPATVTVKNAGVTTLYSIAANVTLPAGLVYLGNPEFSVDGGTVWSSAAEPVIAGQLLTWTSDQIPTLADMSPRDVIEIRFNYTVGCGFQGGQLSFQASYENPCATPKLSNVGTFTIDLIPADVLVTVRQVSPAAGEAIDCSGEATWEIDVTNDGDVLIPVVQVIATLDDGLTFVDSAGDPTYGPGDGGSNTGQTVIWELVDLPIDAVATLSITAASAPGGLDCEALTVFIDAFWGCSAVDGDSATDDADCTTTSPTTASISATREPPIDLDASLSPDAIEGCNATTTLTLTVQNTGTVATTSDVNIDITLPSELTYSGNTTATWPSGSSTTDPTGSPGPDLTWDLGANLLPGETLTISFDIAVSCYFTTQTIPITVRYTDCCSISNYSANTTATLTALTPTLTIDKSPANSTLDCYNASDTASWTITVENTGTGTADWIRVVDTLGSSLVLDASDSPTAGAGISMGANIIGWEMGPLAPAETFTATVTAHLAQPTNDCSLNIRRDTATVLWGCGALDGDPNTTAEATCAIGATVQDQANVRIPNLSISPSDITPIFSCSGDGVAPSSGEIELVVRNTGDGDITTDFEITLTESTTGYSVSDRFTNLGGTLPLADGTSQTLVFDSWDVGCGSCDYTITVALDFLDEVCECTENDNLASLPTTITLPDLVVDAAALAVICAGDGQIRIQGPVTLRNDGCGDALTDDVSVRFTVFNGPDCTGTELDTFTVTFTNLSLASNGGTDQQTIDVTRALAACDTCEISIHIEVDEDGAICECDGTNNNLCAGTFDIAYPDLTITDIDFSAITCTADNISGVVSVTVENTGCGASGPFDLRLESDGCLSFADETVASIAALGSTVVDFAITGSWADCGDCSCTFTATVDPANDICECDGTNNVLSQPYVSTLPDLEISGAVASIGCVTDGSATVSADLTIENTGCADVTVDYDIRVTLYDGANCTGTIVDTWIETISGETVSAGGSNLITLTQHVLSQSLCEGDCDYSAQFEVDANNDICECDGTDNLFCLSSIVSEIPNLVVTDVDASVNCVAGTAAVTATVGNTGCGDATGVVFRLTSPACGLSIDSAPVDLAAGASQDIVFAYTPDCDTWNCTYVVTADPDTAICECDGANTLTFTPYPGIGSIGDTVWFDANGTGALPDPGEDGIPGVTVIIEGDLDGDGSIDYTAATVTNANGEYLFDNLPAGDYTLTVDDTTLPAGLDQTYDYDGLGTPHTSDYTLAEDEDNREQDFGYRGSGSIGDTVWFDADADGIQDPGEDGIPNVTVTLEGDVDGDGIDEVVTTTTDADGLYLFDFLPAGDYTITVDNTTLPDGLAQTYDADGLGTAHTSDYSLAAGEDNLDQDFGYRGTGSIGDTVWFDADGDGIQDPGEDGIPGVTVSLEGDFDADGIIETITTVTDEDGLYLFEYLPAGDYTVTVDDTTLPAGLAQTYDADGLGTPHSSDLTLGPGEDNLDQDFGYRGTGSIGDTVWFDANADGIQDPGEDGIPNVTVTLEGDVDGDGIDEIVTTTTDADGLYLFDFLPAGDYTITVDDATLPDGLAQTYDADGLGTAHTSDYSLAAGEDNLDQDFGYRGSGSIGDYVWFDSNGDGVQDPGEEGIENITLILEGDVDGDGIDEILTTTTDADGLYLFDFLPAGDYTITVDDATLPDGVTQTYDYDGLGTAHTSDYPLASGEHNREQDFGYATPALSVDKTIADILRDGASIGNITGPVEPGDVIVYRFVIENVGPAPAYSVGFDDTLPAGIVIETDAPGNSGTYTVTGPTASGSLSLTDEAVFFTAPIDATVNAGETLTATFTARVTSTVTQGVDLTNTAHAFGLMEDGTPIPPENLLLGDTTDTDVEDPDADDTGIVTVGVLQPALSVNKTITDITRGGVSIGIGGSVEPGDIVFYRFVITNVGGGTAYGVNFADTLPGGLFTETDAPGDDGSYAVTSPAASGSLAIADGAASFITAIDETIGSGETLTANFTAIVTSSIEQGVDLVNTAEASGIDGFGTEIPDENAAAGDTEDSDPDDPDADDTGIAIIAADEPALSVDKIVTDIVRQGSSIGTTGPVEPGDIMYYEYTISNVGLGTAYDVEFTDTLPTGMVTETNAPGNAGAYVVSDPAASGSLALADNVSTFATSIDAIISGGETLTATYTVLITSDIEQGVDLINVAATTGLDGAGNPIPAENIDLGDTSDNDSEDPDADDTGIAIIGTAEPALSVDKVITDIVRQGASIGTVGPVEPGDIVFFQYTISNVGLGTAYDVEFTDTLPTGMVIETDAPGSVGSYLVSAPSASGGLALSDGVTAFTTGIDATIDGGETLTAAYTVLVTSDIDQGVDLINVATAIGLDGAGSPIPAENADLGDTSDNDSEDPDADDTGITVLGTREPALSVDKQVTDVIRDGVAVGVVDPLLFYDVVEYTVTIRNVGLGTAYAVDFTDTIPAGLETETEAPGNAGTYVVTDPSASGSLSVPDAVSNFTTATNATIHAGERFVATYSVLVTPAAIPAVNLVNSASAIGNDGAGNSIPAQNPATGDTTDDDVEDPDADDTGIAAVRVGSPALVTRKAVAAIDRQGTALSDTLVQPGDIVTYEVGVLNVGSGPAQNVNLVDVLPTGFLYEGNASASWPSGSSTADPSGMPGPTLIWTVNAALEANEEFVLTFDARVTSNIEQAATYTNTITATGEDAAGQPIPPDYSDVVPEDDDPDDASEVDLTGAVPALVTDKSILTIVRNGNALGPESTVQSSDIVTYQLDVKNVGLAIAYEVDVRDTLPNPFAYIPGTTQGNWPFRIGAFTRNPTGAPGPTLLWDTDATLDAGDTLTLIFDAVVDGAVTPGDPYTNILQATGIDGAETPIPPNRSADVPGDIDPDDRDEVSLIGIADVPALITSKRVTGIIRNGNPVFDTRIEEGDIVEYELTVENVGAATAYNVVLSDELPTAFTYIDDTTTASWPLGSSFGNPSTGFAELQWSLNATLRSSDRLVLQFLAFVTGPIYDGSAYTNMMRATGDGPDGSPIPEDQRELVPGDTDPDDASQTTLIGRSAYIEGEGGSLVPVPILRKTAEVVSRSTCETWTASVDRLWFQTDIAMYAAAEFELLSLIPDASALIPDSLLPTWIRTVQSETSDYALDNVLQVNALSSVGISLSYGPLVQEEAGNRDISAIQVLEERFDTLAARAGVSQASLPLPSDWIFLEYEGGEPIYQTWRDSPLGTSGMWTEIDNDIIASALGIGLLKQVMEAETLLDSDASVDRFLGWVLVEAIANKIIALESTLTVREDSIPNYVPHGTQWNPETTEYTVSDAASRLFDQLSLLWGLSKAAVFVDAVPAAWAVEETEQRNRVRGSIARTLHEVLLAIDGLHLTNDKAWIGRIVPGTDDLAAASTTDLGLLLVALDAAQAVVNGADAELVGSLRLAAINALIARQETDGWFSATDSPSTDESWLLLPQLAAIRGLLAGSDWVPQAIEHAQAAFDALDATLWIDDIGMGLYASNGSTDWQTFCYSPLDIGLATGALRELALESTKERSAHILSRMSRFLRTIVDEAALQLSNATPAAADFVRGSGAGTIAAIQTDDATGRLAPVLQQRLCLDDEKSDAACGGWTMEERAPWYQTDISMFAAFVVQDRLPRIEDYADANLTAVTLHSGLGITFDSIPALQPSVERIGLETNASPAITSGLNPIAMPYAGGNPETTSETLAWNAGSFDTRILASAQGMTLLREAQEARQLLNKTEKEPHEQVQEHLLLSSILQKLILLRQLQIEAAGSVSYIPHAVAGSDLTPDSWTVLDSGSTTFDQLSLLFGLSEAYALLSDARIQPLVDAQPFPAAQWATITRELTGDVLRTLEIAHLDPIAKVLMDQAAPTPDGWMREEGGSLVNLGLLASALDHVLTSFGATSEIGSRARALLTAEVSFLQIFLADPRGGFTETWPSSTEGQADCDQQTLAGQASALRALQSAQQWIGLDAEIVDRSFRILDARFWDPSLSVYRTQSALFEWCVSPLDLGLTIDALSRMVDKLANTEKHRLETRLTSHVDRILDGIPLQLTESLAIPQGELTSSGQHVAPVFDALACFQSSAFTQGAGTAKPGDTIRYSISAENVTEETFYNLQLEDLLPDGVIAIASDPVGEDDDPFIRWQFDDLLPSEVRTWQILALVDEDVAIDNVLQNCATLTYTTANGDPLPPREACADTDIQSSESSLPTTLETIDVTYLTDEAMHLATSLTSLACLSEFDWQTATLAHTLSDENLGILLSESGLGVPLVFAPELQPTDNPIRRLEETLHSYALDAGLSEAPAVGLSILLPYESGVPIVINGSGFSVLSDVITPASLGWMLAREAQYALSCLSTDDPLNRYLVNTVRFRLDNQLTWISTATIPSATGNDYLPHAIRATMAGNVVSYGVSDTRSTVYDQASLLLGLLAAAQPNSLEIRGQRLAEQLASDTFEQLVSHWKSDSQMFVEPLETEAISSEARWVDLGIAAQALSLSQGILPREKNTATTILAEMAEHAMTQEPEFQGVDEAGRLIVLAIAGDTLSDDVYRSAALSGWELFRARHYEPTSGRYIFSPQAARGWGHTPGQLAIVFDLIRLLSRYPGEASDALRVANALLIANVLEDRVQLISPTEYWTSHSQVRCSGILSVFAEHRGMLPPWFDLLP